MSVAIYARVSTSDQNPTMQVEELKKFAEARFWEVFDYYVDEEHGDTKSRPALDRMMKDAQARKFRAVLVWKFDRFARSLIHLVTALENFRALSVDFISLKDSVDTTTPQGKFFFHIFAAIAEYERDTIRERVRSGMANARAQGKRLGRPTVAVDSLKVAELRAAGASWREISRQLSIGIGTARRAVALPCQKGVRRSAPK